MDTGGLHTSGRDPLYSLPIGVDEGHVLLVEGVEVGVVEARTLAEHLVVRLERLGHGRIDHHCIYPGSDLLHLFEVGHLEHLFERPVQDAGLATAEDLHHPADQGGPPVIDEIDLLGHAGDQCVEVTDPSLLPPRLQPLDPRSISRAVATDIDGRRGALEDMEVASGLS